MEAMVVEKPGSPRELRLQQAPQVHHELEHRTAPPKTVLSVGRQPMRGAPARTPATAGTAEDLLT